MKVGTLANTIFAGLLTLSFCLFFQYTKHGPDIAPVVPFLDDPWDAAGSYCFIVTPLLTLLALFRAWRMGTDAPTSESKTLLARTWIAIPVCILVTLAIDGVAMIRHRIVWWNTPGGKSLCALVVALAAASVIAILRMRLPQREVALDRRQWRFAAFWTAATLVVFAFFPESVIHSLPLHLLAILTVDVLVAGTQAAAIEALTPYENLGKTRGDVKARRNGRWISWAVVSLAGATLGALLVAIEWMEGGPPAGRRLLVFAVFVGCGMALILTAYGFLRKPLGLSRE